VADCGGGMPAGCLAGPNSTYFDMSWIRCTTSSTTSCTTNRSIGVGASGRNVTWTWAWLDCDHGLRDH